jgi:hypothetical protein
MLRALSSAKASIARGHLLYFEIRAAGPKFFPGHSREQEIFWKSCFFVASFPRSIELLLIGDQLAPFAFAPPSPQAGAGKTIIRLSPGSRFAWLIGEAVAIETEMMRAALSPSSHLKESREGEAFH